jgi:hypothetical protein
MRNIDNDFKFLFSQLKECHSCISVLNPKREKDHPIRKLFEAFSLCSGACYGLCMYQHFYQDLDDNSKNKNEESWDIYNEIENYQGFFNRGLHPSPIIRSDFRSMSIANTAFRLSAAGVIISDVIRKAKLNTNDSISKIWPYVPLLKEEKLPTDWDRNQLYGNNKGDCVDISQKPEFHRNLSLLVALRDEYGHSEFDERYKCRIQIREKYPMKNIINAEMEILQESLAIIHCLCENHLNDLKKS